MDTAIQSRFSFNSIVGECAKKYAVHRANIYRWWAFYVNWGEIHIVIKERMKFVRKKYKLGSSRMNPTHLEELKRILDVHPEFYLDEFMEELASRTGVYYSISTISRTLRQKLNYSLKVCYERATQQCEALRGCYRSAVHGYLDNHKDPPMLIFIDETHKDKNASRRRRAWGL